MIFTFDVFSDRDDKAILWFDLFCDYVCYWSLPPACRVAYLRGFPKMGGWCLHFVPCGTCSNEHAQGKKKRGSFHASPFRLFSMAMPAMNESLFKRTCSTNKLKIAKLPSITTES